MFFIYILKLAKLEVYVELYFGDLLEEIYKDHYATIQTKIAKKNKAFRSIITPLTLLVALLIFHSPIQSAFTQIFRNMWIVAFGQVILLIPVLVLFLWRVDEKEKLGLTLKDSLFHEIYNLHAYLEKFVVNREESEYQDKVFDSLDQIADVIELNVMGTKAGFNSEILISNSLNIFRQSIPKYETDLENPSQDKLREYVSFFKNLLIYLYNEEFDKFSKLVKTKYDVTDKIKEDKLHIFTNALKVRAPIFRDYAMALSISIILCYLIVRFFKLPLFSDLSSAIAGIVSISILTNLIKTTVIDGIRNLWNKQE